MKAKKIILAIAVLAAAYTGASWYSGQQTQAWYEQSTQHYVDLVKHSKMHDQMQYKIVDYQRGWFSSSVVSTITIFGQEITLVDHIKHGPYLGANDAIFGMAAIEGQIQEQESLRAWFAASKDKTPYRAHSILSYAKDLRGEFELAPFTLEQGNELISFSGLTGTFNADAGFKNTDTRLNADQLTISWINSSEKFAFEDFSYQEHREDTQVTSEILLGKFASTYQGLDLQLDKLRTDISIENLMQSNQRLVSKMVADVFTFDTFFVSQKPRITYQLNAADGLVDIQLGLGFDNLLVVKNAYNAGKVDFAINLERLDVATLEKLQNTSRLSDQARMAITLELLKNKPIITLDPVIWQNEKGTSQLYYKNQVNRLNIEHLAKLMTGDDLDQYDLKAIVPLLDWRLDVSWPQLRELLENTEAEKANIAKALTALQTLADSQVLQHEKNNFKFAFSIIDGQIMLNQQVMDFAAFKALMLAAGEKLDTLD